MIVSSCLHILMQTHAISIYRNSLIRQKAGHKYPTISSNPFWSTPKILFLCIYIFSRYLWNLSISILWKLRCMKNENAPLKRIDFTPMQCVGLYLDDLGFKSKLQEFLSIISWKFGVNDFWIAIIRGHSITTWTKRGEGGVKCPHLVTWQMVGTI
jgi:hypothetical protein